MKKQNKKHIVNIVGYVDGKAVLSKGCSPDRGQLSMVIKIDRLTNSNEIFIGGGGHYKQHKCIICTTRDSFYSDLIIKRPTKS